MDKLENQEESTTMSLEEFLRSRDISEDAISYLLNEKIDCSILLITPEDELKKFFPKYGDRIAVQNFCKRSTNSKKLSLIEKLKNRIQGKNAVAANTRTSQESKGVVRRNLKKTRIIEVGWLCTMKKDEAFRQIRTSAGGGTRRISIDKNSKCSEILEKAKSLFFPSGISTKGRLYKFDIELLDYKSHKFDLDLTVQEMYEISAMTTLRFYLATTSKEHVITSDDEDYIPSTVESFTEPIEDCQEVVEVSEENPESGNSLANFYGTFINNMQCEENGTIPEIDLDLNSSVTQLPSINYESYNLSVILETNLADNIHQLRQSEISSDLETDTSRISKEKNKIILHRGKVFEEFIEALKTHYIYDFKTITIVMILPNGVPEPAEDLGGVLRDAISEFWDEFYDKCTIGTDYKVPFLRHDFGEPEWRAISKFLVKGWESESYFPIRIAPIFIKHCFEQTIEADDILNNFLKYVCETDANILKGALQDFDTVEYDDLLECVGNYDSKWLPTKNNFRKLLTDIAHKEIIQKPAFVAQCFAQELRGSICNCNLETIYKQLKPTVKNVLSKLETNETNLTPQKITIYGYLKKFIKELDEKSRSAFLRFCTGSDLVIKNVQVHFVDIEGITRSPIAHTCTGILELPTSYENFVVFRTEFNNLLNSKIWVMDIV